jgi:hypothetical protein
MTRLVLTRPHTHAGKSYGIGDRIEVDADAAEWLLAHDIATREPRPARTEPDLSPIQRKEPKQ